MADTTENKTYLVNIESNLAKYAEEADKAARKVAELTVENDRLKQSTTATGAEIEAGNAALRNAKKEYTDAKKLVDLQTQANNSNAESRKQLNAIVTLEQRRLGALANQYVINEKGQRVLSASYLDQVVKVKNAKDAIIAYDKAQSDGRSSVGLYSEAIEASLGKFKAMPGVLGAAAGGIARVSASFKVLLANPVVLIITAIVAALGLLIKAFKGNDEATEKFNGIMKGIGLAIKEVLGRIVSLGKAIGELFRGNFKEAADLAKEAVLGFAGALVDAYGAGVEQQKLLNQIEDEEIALIETRARREKEIAALKLKSRDLEEGSVMQAGFLRKAQELINANLKDELVLQQKRVQYAQSVLDFTNKNQVTDEMRRNLAEEKAKLLQLETQALNEQAGLMRQLNTLDAKSVKEIEARVKAMEDSKKALATEIIEYKKWISDRKRLDTEALEDKRKQELDQAEWERERQLTDHENLLEIQELNLEDEFSIRRERLELMHQDEIASTIKTGADINIINRKYALAQIELTKQEQDAKLAVYAGFAGSIATLFGENTALGRIAAVTATIINTYRGAMAAFAETPGGIVIKSLAAAAAVATGIASVKKIMSTKSGLPGDSGGGSASIPTSITSTPVAQRTFAAATGSTILTQTQLSQQQLNSLPNENFLTAEDIARALERIPAPIVTVEDINAKVDEVNKVKVRANI